MGPHLGADSGRPCLRRWVSGLAHVPDSFSVKPSLSDLQCAVHQLLGLDFSLELEFLPVLTFRDSATKIMKGGCYEGVYVYAMRAVCVHVCMCVCMCMHLCVHVHVCVYMCMCVPVYVCVYVYVYVPVCVCVSACLCAHVCL